MNIFVRVTDAEGFVAEAVEFSNNKVVVSSDLAPYTITMHDNLIAAKQAYPMALFVAKPVLINISDVLREKLLI